VRNQEWDPALAKLGTLHLSELIFCLLGLDPMNGESALGVVDQAEVLASLLDGNDVHETSRVGRIGADLSVDLDETLHHDGLGLTGIEGVLQSDANTFLLAIYPIILFKNLESWPMDEPVTDKYDQWQTVPKFVRTRGRARSIGSGHFVQEPVLRRTKALLVLLSI
jgi:hypothetical protein